MMYKLKMAAAIKVNGRVLREEKDIVRIPFGSEYTILLKNLETKRAMVNVYIDGENVVPGGLVLNAGQEIDLERSIKNNNLNEGNRFKFIERTGAIENHRGIKLEDGLVRIEYQYEYIQTYYQPGDTRWVYLHEEKLPHLPLRHGILRSTSVKGIVTNDSYTACSSTSQAVANEAGITVPGSKSEQKFEFSGWFPTEAQKHNLVFRLVGDLGDDRSVTKPVTVKHKPRCVTCGHTNKANAQFCNQCGTALEIFA